MDERYHENDEKSGRFGRFDLYNHFGLVKIGNFQNGRSGFVQFFKAF